MLPLFHAAQVNRVLARFLDVQAERALVERPAARKVGDAQRDMARPHDVEGRVGDVAWRRHGRVSDDSLIRE